MSRRVIIIDKASDLNLIEELIAEENLVAYDLETNSLSPRKGRIIGLSIANSKSTCYIIMKSWQGGQLVDVVPYDAVKPIVALLQGKQIVGWNISFDSRFTIEQLGVDLRPSIYGDAMLARHLGNENEFSYALKQTAKEVYGAQAISEQADMFQSIKDNGGDKHEYYKADSQVLARYGASDASLTYDLFHHFYNQLSPSLKEFYHTETMPMNKYVVQEMELTGLPLDMPLLQASLQEINFDLSQLEDKIQLAIKPLLPAFNEWFINKSYPFKLTGEFKTRLGQKIAPKGWPKTASGSVSLSKADVAKAKKNNLIPIDSQFERIVNGLEYCSKKLIHEIQLEMAAEDGIKYPFNLLSKDALKRLFFGTKNTPSPLNERALSFTDKGSPQIDSDFLDSMSKKYDWCKDLQIFNKLIKLRGTYIERFLEEQEDGVFYPAFFQHRTTSGRLAGDAQQFPRAIKTGDTRVIKYTNLIRQFFTAPEENTFVDMDFDSQEVKVFAHVSGDDGLKQIFSEGKDFYSEISINAEKLQGYSADKAALNYLGLVNKEARQKAKSYALGLAFGMSPYKLKFELNCSEFEAKQIYNGYMSAYPKLKQWMDRTRVLATSEGLISTEAGRVRHLPQLKELYEKYGEILFDGLQLWQRYNDQPSTYKYMKEMASKAKNDINNAYNFQIQGLAASITNRAAVKFARLRNAAGLKTKICAIIHDEIVLLAPLTELEQVSNILTEAMETAYPISVPMTAPKSSGPNLAVSKG